MKMNLKTSHKALCYKVSFMGGCAGRVQPGDKNPDGSSAEGRNLGFYWWFWLPSFSHNNGRFSKQECVDLSVHWFAFYAHLIFFPERRL